MSNTAETTVIFNGTPLSTDQVEGIARGSRAAQLSDDNEFQSRIQRGANFLEKVMREDGVIYGVTTGYGDSCGVSVPPEQVDMLYRPLYPFHGCGMGEPFSVEETRAVLVARLASLCQGYSGVRHSGDLRSQGC